MSVIHVAVDLKVTRVVIYNLIKAATTTLLGTVPQEKGSGEPRKSSLRTDTLLKCKV